MPRPTREGGPPIVMGVLIPEAIYHCTRRGFHIQTTPLSGTHQHMLEQVDAFNRGKDDLGEAGRELTLSLSRVAFLAKNEKSRKEKIQLAHRYYGQFDNISTGDGIVKQGLIATIPRKVPIEQTEENLHICTPEQMIEELLPYAEAGVDRFILNVNFGASQSETLDCIQQFAEDVMPVFENQ